MNKIPNEKPKKRKKKFIPAYVFNYFNCFLGGFTCSSPLLLLLLPHIQFSIVLFFLFLPNFCVLLCFVFCVFPFWSVNEEVCRK